MDIQRRQYFSDAIKTGNYQNVVSGQQPRSLIIDPMASASAMGYYPKETNLSYNILRQMARTPLPAAVMNTRKNQIAEFLKPQETRYSKGFVIRPTSKAEREKDELTDMEKRDIEKIENIVMNCGDDDSTWQWDSFDTFIRKIVDDSLTLDQACFEVIPYALNSMEPHSVVAVDGATMRIASTFDNMSHTAGKLLKNGVYPSYCQVYQGSIIQEFYPWEMCFGVRNPSTAIERNGYGTSELENLINTITHLINADTYNGNFFKQGAAPKGMLMVKKPGASVNSQMIAEFSENWHAKISGVQNAHTTPFLDAEAFEWLNFQQNNRDMEYFKFVEYLVKIVCAVYTISGEEIGFRNEGSYTGTGLGGKNNEQEKAYSLSKGLFPLLTSIERWINKFWIKPKTKGRYEFKFVGGDIESEQSEEDRLNKGVTTYMTVNEVRKVKGLPPLSDGDIILSPVLQQAKAQEFNQALQTVQMNATYMGDLDGDLDTAHSAQKELTKSEYNPFIHSLNEFALKNDYIQA